MFSVTWSAEAYQDLGRVWEALPYLHPHLRVARDVVDHHLRNDPIGQSEGREVDTRRILFAYPLGILFDVNVDEKKVLVLTAWAYELPT